MAFVPGYQYDLFVSYASVDNEPFPSAERGWVDTLVQILTSGSGLAGKLGRREAFEWWIDKQHLRGHHEVNSHIPEQVRQSALLLVILSPGYLASKFCRLELQTFLETSRKKPGRVFVVNREPTVERRRESVPESLRTLRKYEFWELDKNNKPRILGWPQPNPKNPDDRDRLYYQKVEDVCQEIAEKLEELKAELSLPVQASSSSVAFSDPARTHKPASAKTVPGDRRPVVLLAETTDDLLRRRDEVQRYLEQAGIDVLPSGTYYGLSATEYEQSLKNDLAKCSLFVQLLGPELGRRVEGIEDGFGWLQHNIAKQLERPILQWRGLELTDLRSIEEPKQRQLLQSAEAMPIEEFKLKIVRSLATQTTKPSSRPSFFFINCDSVDVSEADTIGGRLGDHVDWERPLYEEKPKAKVLQEAVESRLVDCDGLLILHGKSPLGWVRAQLQLYRKLRQRRASDPRVLAVVQLNKAPQLNGVGLAGLQVVGVNDLPAIIKAGS
jgi:hypothetical protein